MKNPERIYNVSATQFSIARHYGGCKVNGVDYCYDRKSDTLIRQDVLKAELKITKKNAADEKSKSIASQHAFNWFLTDEQKIAEVKHGTNDVRSMR